MRILENMIIVAPADEYSGWSKEAILAAVKSGDAAQWITKDTLVRFAHIDGGIVIGLHDKKWGDPAKRYKAITIINGRAELAYVGFSEVGMSEAILRAMRNK